MSHAHQRRAALRWMGMSMAAGAMARMGLVQAASQVQPARRLVSLSGALTEMVYHLGAESLLVGTDTTSLYPEAAQKTAKVGYVRQLSAEGLLALRPDAVIGTMEAGPAVVLDQLRAAGVRVSLIEGSNDWAEVQAKLQLVGRETGRASQAQALQLKLDRQWQQVQERVARAGRQPRALFMLAHGGTPSVAGRGTSAHALISMAGGVNAGAAFEGYRPLTAEAMAAAAPDVLINTEPGIEAMGGETAFWRRPELALTPAFARKALVMVDAGQLLGFGPRLPEAVDRLHRQFQSLVA
ncbi:heme/hemin ABC transporter substrate-binding protein [Comamonas composti]|uniref:heme/hemin ABC transporter substrate-binding protein n=1 Tax=Comamonas composti TaxID=408558 RepID=UPI0004277F14|nr:ABC transporter substrate-binding protein [Comamonas composti]